MSFSPTFFFSYFQDISNVASPTYCSSDISFTVEFGQMHHGLRSIVSVFHESRLEVYAELHS
jgi:hypothetical protein